jgi:hypothetical protein
MPPNFVLLDSSNSEVASLISAMVGAREAVDRRSWSHPMEPVTEEWWADVLADPHARTRMRRSIEHTLYRLADEPREIVLVACTNVNGRQPSSVPS